MDWSYFEHKWERKADGFIYCRNCGWLKADRGYWDSCPEYKKEHNDG